MVIQSVQIRRIFSKTTKYLIVILGLLALFTAYCFLERTLGCHLPVAYSIGNIDARFKVSPDLVKEIAHESELRWNNQTTRQVLTYSADSKFTINLIYDDRQADLDELKQHEQSVRESSQSVENLNQDFKSFLENYNKDLDAFNKKVTAWNSQGGVPKDTFDQLTIEGREIDQRRRTLIKIAESLNYQINNYNEDLTQLKDTINHRKNNIITQGLYKPRENRIDIYTFGNNEELRLVLMHELGHAIGLEHAKQPTSLMFSLLDAQDLANPRLTNEDLQMLDNRCGSRNERFVTVKYLSSQLIEKMRQYFSGAKLTN